jgi:hypothetical protein
MLGISMRTNQPPLTQPPRRKVTTGGGGISRLGREEKKSAHKGCEEVFQASPMAEWQTECRRMTESRQNRKICRQVSTEEIFDTLAILAGHKQMHRKLNLEKNKALYQ